MYATVDRPGTKQYRKSCTAPDVIVAVKAGQPVPDGAVSVLPACMAQADAAGVPLKDANGRFMKGTFAAVNMQQKKEGWGGEIPAAVRNGDCPTSRSRRTAEVDEKADLTACCQCRLPFAKDECLTNIACVCGLHPTTQGTIEAAAK